MPTLSTIGAACARAWGFTSGLVKDQYFNLVSLLLPGNGTNGAQNNTFLDGSSNTFTITRNGNTTQGTFSPFSQTGWGNYFGGSSYINAPSINFSTSDFTIEFFINAGSLAANQQPISGYTSSGINYAISIGSANEFRFFLSSNGTTWDIASAVTLGTATIGKWHHIVIVRSGSSIRGYFDGTGGTTVTSSAGIYNNGVGFYIGAAGGGGGNFTGYLSNVRVLLGTAAYSPASSTITVPTAPFATGTTNQVLLTCQANRFVDSNTATTAKTITVSGSAQVTPFSPFAPTQSYSAAAVGGSGYFDGTGDYLATASDAAFGFGTGDFTVEAWVYITGGIGEKTLLCVDATGGANIFLSSTNQIGIGRRGVDVNNFFGATPVSNAWAHVAMARSGTSITCWVNGAVSGTQSQSNSINYSSGPANIGAIATYGGQNFAGYMGSYRVVKGTAVYNPSSSTITVPTAPLTAVSGTSLLLNFTNGGVIDATAKNVLETVGNAQISTTQSKWGGGSIYLDGTSNTYVRGPVQIYLGSSNFTIEGWVRFPTSPGAGGFDIYKLQDKNDGSSLGALRLLLNSSMKLHLLLSTAGSAWNVSADNLGNVLSTNVWYYIAVTRSGSDFKVYVDGSQAGATQTLSGALYAGPINALGWNGISTYSNMYFDDVRLTIGLARNVTTSPTAPFPVQ